MPELTLGQWFIAAVSVLLIGFSKTGIGGLGTIAIPMMALLFGGRASSGVLLPLLIAGDLIAVRKYRTHTEWPLVLKLMPWAMVGIVVGVFAGRSMDDALFKRIIAIIVLSGLVVMIVQEVRRETEKVPEHWAFAAALGLCGGFATMIGNAAGPIMAIYLLSMRLPKMAYIGTGAWFFMIINVTKVPFQVLFWKGITLETLKFDALLLPVLILGALLGLILVRKIPERPFRYTVIVLTGIASLRLLF